jgi:CHRD domain
MSPVTPVSRVAQAGHLLVVIVPMNIEEGHPMVTVDAARRTRRLAIVLASASVLLAGASLPAAHATGDNDSRGKHRTLEATLTGAKEVPGPGDPDGRGKAQIRLKKDQVCFDLSWRNIEAPTAAHIHRGTRDVAGPVVVLFFEVSGGLPALVSSVGGCAPAKAELITEIRENPRAFYVNIHNADFGAGAIRGQLHR